MRETWADDCQKINSDFDLSINNIKLGVMLSFKQLNLNIEKEIRYLCQAMDQSTHFNCEHNK